MKTLTYSDFTPAEFAQVVEKFYKQHKDEFAQYSDGGYNDLEDMAASCYREYYADQIDLSDPETRNQFDTLIAECYENDPNFPEDLWAIVNDIESLCGNDPDDDDDDDDDEDEDGPNPQDDDDFWEQREEQEAWEREVNG